MGGVASGSKASPGGWTRWDARQLVRATLAAAVTFGLAWLVTAATDEGGVSWSERAGRTLPLTPVCAAIGAWVALAPAIARGETVALEALGRSRVQLAGAAIAGGALVALAAAVVLGLARGVDVAGFFPTARHASAWAWTGAGFFDPVQGLRVGLDGAPVNVATDGAGAGVGLGGAPPYGRAAAAALTGVAGLALPLLLAHALLERARLVPVVLASIATAAASVLLLQAAAARHVPAALGTLPAVALLAFAVQRYRGRGG